MAPLVHYPIMPTRLSLIFREISTEPSRSRRAALLAARPLYFMDAVVAVVTISSLLPLLLISMGKRSILYWDCRRRQK